MKKTMILMGVVCLFATTSCKKGDEDPALSLLTRKARLTGEWDIRSFEINREYYYNNELYSTSQATLENGLIIQENELVSGNSTSIQKDVLKSIFTFRKDGTWEQEMEMNYSTTEYSVFYTETQEGEEYQIKRGTWAFEGKTKDKYKNKERLVLSVLMDSTILKNVSFEIDYHSENETDLAGNHDDYIRSDNFLANENIEVYSIIRLSNKELKLELGEDFSDYTSEEKHYLGDCYLRSYSLIKR